MNWKRRNSLSVVAILILMISIAAPAVAAAPSMSASVFGLRISFEECRSRVADALAAEGYGNLRDFGNGWLGFTSSYAASVACIHGNNETVVNIVVASDGQNVEQRDRLEALIRKTGTGSKSRYLAVERGSGGNVVVRWQDTPGNAQDWISIRPAGSPDDTYGSTWRYLEGKSTGSHDFGPLPAGEYEVRLYFDWPNGGYNVRDRLRFRVGG